uniref:methyltransferase-like protein 22 n=1 Tax=Styela clava TaxID=7725 RepID=UPI0019399C7D|nr:methyltransferase-like protein 22 [Styela clava]
MCACADELILSDVQLNRDKDSQIVLNKKHGEYAIHLVDFHIKLPGCLIQIVSERTEKSFGITDSIHDDDGDLIVSRSAANFDKQNQTLNFRIHHAMETHLADVGLQVWMGALGMIDFMLDNVQLFRNKQILELGAGVGLTGIVAGTLTNKITLTDVGENILGLCEMNYHANQNILQSPPHCFEIRELNWHKPTSIKSLCIPKPDIIMACDVIYDNDITNAFFQTLQILLNGDTYTKEGCRPSIVKVYISTEKRLNFTLEDLDITCKEYNHFLCKLSELENTFQSSLSVQRIDMEDISQFCQYNQTQQLEIWEIQKQL